MFHSQEKEPHETHSFEWWGDDKKLKNFTCNKAGTVESLLKRSSQFTEIMKKNKNRELVIVRDGKAISSHFPCSLIKNERLTVRFVKAVDKPNQSVNSSVAPKKMGPSSELVMFHVLTNGGTNLTKIMRNPALRAKIEEITVYAYKGETVKQALRRDGRFLLSIFKKNCVLSHKSTEVITEMSNLVDDLNDKTFKIILLNKSRPPESQPGSLDDAYMMQNESQRSDSDGNQDPPQQSTTMSEIPNSEKIKCHLSSKFQDSVKGRKTLQGSRLSHVQNLFRVEYGKNAETCREVKTMKKLMDLSNSVCQVRINGRPIGSGFLMFDKFVLTNGHIVRKIYNEPTGQLNEKVTVYFSYESLDQMESGAEVEEVVGFEYYHDQSGHQYDWALLRLAADHSLPDGLLTHFGFLPQSGGICIIGHPDCGVKRIDPCLIIPSDDRNQVVEQHYHENPEGVWLENGQYCENQGPVHLITPNFFESVAASVKHHRPVLTYGSCFYSGSSGSPVFDEYCNVVAMHSGGYPYRNARHERQSVLEYGYPLSVIIEHIIVQIVQRERFDVLKEYLACSYVLQPRMMTSVKKLVESRNLVAFKNATNNSVVTNDESLKAFFEFFSQKEQPVPMDTD